MNIKEIIKTCLIISLTAVTLLLFLLGGCGNTDQDLTHLNEENPRISDELTSISALPDGSLSTFQLPTPPGFPDGDPKVLKDTLLGPGIIFVDILPIIYQGRPWSAGTFLGGTGIINFESGILLSTGNIVNVPGPNISDSTDGNNNLPGDTDLDTLASAPTFDATVLEFSFIPTRSIVMFDYVFGSEEYNEYVNSPVNNVLGFFVNGVNQALIPGTSVTIAVNNINNGNPEPADTFLPDVSNSGLYRDNDRSTQGIPTPIDTELDGLTTVLSFVANVNEDQINSIKLAIANAGSSDLDSAIFIKEGSFISPPITLEPISAINNTGTTHTVTATVEHNGELQPDVDVIFRIVEGPHTGLTSIVTTDSFGQATWSYTGASGSPLPDKIIASATINSVDLESNSAFKLWQFPDLPPVELRAVEYRWGEPEPGYMWDPFPDFFKGWLNVRIENMGIGNAFDVTASISSWPIHTTVVDPNVLIGNIPSGGSAWSVDSFTTRVQMDSSIPPCAGVFWRIGYNDANGVHHAIENVPEFPPGEGPCP
jgi:hypothetical protein